MLKHQFKAGELYQTKKKKNEDLLIKNNCKFKIDTYIMNIKRIYKSQPINQR